MNTTTGLAYRGWHTLAASFSCALLVVGGTVYCFGLYVEPFSEAFGLTRTEMYSGIIALNVGVLLWSPFTGRLFDKAPASLLVAFGGMMLGLGLFSLSRATSIFEILACIIGPLALAIVCAGPMGTSTIAARWFQRRRGRAMGLVAISTAAGGFVMPQIAAYLITHYGWRDALALTGAGAGLLIVVIALLFVRSNATEADLRAGGEWIDEDETQDEEESPHTDERVWKYGELLRAPSFWYIALGVGLLMGSDQALLISKVPYLLDIGIELQAAAFLVACQSASSILGKLGLGWAADRVALPKLFAFVALAHLVLLATLIAQPGYWTLLIVLSLVGIAIGGVYPILTMLVAAVFGARSYGTAYGLLNSFLMLFNLSFVYFTGRVYDATGSYQGAFLTFGAVVFVSIFLVGRVQVPNAPGSQGTALPLRS